MGYATEFPHVCGEYPDLTELLCLYRKLTGEYTEMLDRIAELDQELKDYEKNIELRIPGWIQEKVQVYVDTVNAVKDELEKDMADLQKQIVQLMNEYSTKWETALLNQEENVRNALSRNEAWVSGQLEAQNQHIHDDIKGFQEWFDWHSKEFEQVVKDRLKDNEEKVKHAIDKNNAKMQVLKNTMDALRSEVDILETQLHDRYEELTALIRTYNTVMRLWYWNNRYKDKKWLGGEIGKLRQEIEDLPKSTLPVDNPFEGGVLSVNDYLKFMYEQVLPIGGITAGEWHNATWITCEVFNALNPTALEFYVNGKHVFERGDGKWMTFSPISGKYVWIGTALQEVANALNANAVTAGKYDEKQITASTYDEKAISAGQYRKGELDGLLEDN